MAEFLHITYVMIIFIFLFLSLIDAGGKGKHFFKSFFIFLR